MFLFPNLNWKSYRIIGFARRWIKRFLRLISGEFRHIIEVWRSFQLFVIGSLCAIDCNSFPNESKSRSLGGNSLKEIFDGILWAVPTHRRTLERRLKRRFGVMKYMWKPPIAKTNILMCSNCGHNYEAGHLCGKFHQYKIIIDWEKYYKISSLDLFFEYKNE